MISDERGKNMKKNDWLLAGGILAVCVIFFAVHFLRHREGEGQAVISVSGEEYAVYSLSADRTVSIGDTNRLIIENGTAAEAQSWNGRTARIRSASATDRFPETGRALSVCRIRLWLLYRAAILLR